MRDPHSNEGDGAAGRGADTRPPFSEGGKDAAIS